MTFEGLKAIARIRDQANDKEVLGAGFLVSDKYIITCAHVVNAAVGKPLDTTDEPDKEICLDFPLVASGKILKGRVVRWIPVQPSSSILPETGADIALLELESTLPKGIQPIRLITAENLWKHPFGVFGFPKGQSSGVYTDGIIRETQGNGRVQIDVLPSSAYRIEPGFSGSPVWDEQLDGVVGMTVAIDSPRTKVKAKFGADFRAAFITPTTQLINACPELAEQAIPPCPYRGLFAFREQDAQYFFGREKFTEKLVEAVRRQSLVAVIGASGSGKSSVVFAGLIPQLRSQEGWLIESFRPGDNPLKNLAAKLVPLLKREMSPVDQLVEVNKLVNRLQEGELGLHDVVKLILENNSGSRLLLIADQFEELYSLCQDNSARQLFLDQLLETVKQIDNFKLVLTLRADFLGYALSYRPFADALQDADRKLGPMNHEELQEAIEKPAQKLGIRLESGLTERILEAVEKEPGNLPLLEFALTLLWAKQKNGQLTHQAYEDIRGVEKALAEYAQEQYESLNKEDKQRAQQMFIQLVRPGEGTEDTRRLATRDEVGEDNWDLVTKLASARLVVTNKTEKTDEKEETEQETVEIIHEALIREWGMLRDWMNENREFRTWQERLKVRIQEWEKSGKDDGALLENVALAEAEEILLEKSSDKLSKSQRNYIELSLELRDRRQKEEEERRDRELKQEKKARKAAQTRTIVAVISTVVVGAFGIFANSQRQEAQKQASIATLRQEAVEVKNRLVLSGRVDSLVLAIKITGESLTELNQVLISVESSLQSAVQLVKEQNFYHHKDTNLVGFSPDGKHIITTSQNKTIGLWDLEGNQISLPFQDHDKKIISVAFSPDGKYIITGSSDKTARLWDLKGNQVGEPFFGHQGSVNSVAFSPDGKHIITGSSDKTARLWDLKGNQVGEPFFGHQGLVNSVAFSPDGKYIVTGSNNDYNQTTTMKLWDLDGNQIHVLFHGNTESWVNGIVFSPDGKYLIGRIHRFFPYSHDNVRVQFQLWNLESPKISKTFCLWDKTGWEIIDPNCDHKDSIHSVEFSPNSQYIVSSSNDGIIQLWNFQNKNNYIKRSSFVGHEDSVNSVAFSPDGQYIISAGGYGYQDWRDKSLLGTDATITLWDLSGNPISKFHGHDTEINSIALSPDGQYIVSHSIDDQFRLWDLSSNQISNSFVEHNNLASSVMFSPDGRYILSFSPDEKYIVSGSNNGTIQLWDLDNNQISKSIVGHKALVTSVKFSPDGKYIVSGSNDGTIQLWDLDNNQISKSIVGHKGWINSVAFSSNGKYIVSCDNDGYIRVWNFEGSLISETFINDEKYSDPKKPLPVKSAIFGPNDNKIIFISDGGFVHVWDYKNKTVRGGVKWGVGKSAIAFSLDGRYVVASGSDHSIGLLDESTGTGKSLVGHQDSINSIAFSPDGKYIVSGSNDGTIRLWDLEGNQISTIFLGLKKWVESVTFSPNGKYIVSGSSDRTIRLWDLEGNPIGEPFIHYKVWLESVTFSPDGKYIVSGGNGLHSGEHSLVFWNYGWEYWLEVGCNRLRYHPVLKNPQDDIAKEAKKTCDKYVWNR